MQDLKEKASRFKSSARFYLLNKKILEIGNYDQISFSISEDLKIVDEILEDINEKCGSAARLIVYLLYVKNRTQKDIAIEYGYTRRQLQYSISKWFYIVFGGKTTVRSPQLTDLPFGKDKYLKMRIDSFKDSCRIYEKEKEYLGVFMDDDLQKKFIIEDITYTENILRRIETKCGTYAKGIIYELYVEKKTQQDVAIKMNVSLRKLQNLLNQWLYTVFYYDE